MSKLPEARLRAGLISGAALTWLLLFSTCAHSPKDSVAPFETFAGALPRDSASSVPYQPETMRGQVVMITFIASWCFTCLADLISIERLQEVYGARGFRNVLVGMDLEGHRALDPFAQTYSLTCPLVVASQRLINGETVFGTVRELPVRLIFGRDGKFVDGYSGVVAYEALEKVIKRALEHNAP